MGPGGGGTDRDSRGSARGAGRGRNGLERGSMVAFWPANQARGHPHGAESCQLAGKMPVGGVMVWTDGHRSRLGAVESASMRPEMEV